MKKRQITTIILGFLILNGTLSCYNNNTDSIQVITEKDTVFNDEIFMAKLKVNHLESILPVAYTIINGDTFYFPYNEKEKCITIQITDNENGKRELNGIIEYINIKRKKIKKKFTIRYTRIIK